MPIYDIACQNCGQENEILSTRPEEGLACPACGSMDTIKKMSATSSLTGAARQAYPGPGDTSCCGGAPSTAGCAGPGSCCGKRA